MSNARSICMSVSLALGLVVPCGAADLPSPEEVARRFDATLREELALSPEDLAPPAADSALIRRLWLDTLGHPPSRDEASALLASETDLDLPALVPQLLSNRDFGENWARFWVDVLRERGARHLVPDNETFDFLEGELNHGRSWAEIATSVIAAGQDVRNRFVLHDAARPGVAATEVSRIFLGISIECAECHDHPTGQWKREQFREFAAYFDAAFLDEYTRELRKERESEESLANVTPRFFLDGSSIPSNKSDAFRRTDLARRIVSANNPWFARAFVNRICGELLGQGFYALPDDIGPGRECLAPRSLDILADDFAASGYDVRRLFHAILLTDTYRLAGRALSDESAKPFACNRIQPLRGDQFFESMIRALGMREEANREGYIKDMMTDKSYLPPRAITNQIFGFGPSEAREEVGRGIPQALALMNSQMIEKAITDVRNSGGPGVLISRIGNNRELTDALYLHMLSRLPTDEERLLATEMLFAAPTRKDAFVDLTWALFNSAEFSHRP